MKIIKKIKTNNSEKIKFLGLTVYKKFYNNSCGYIKILFFKFKYKNYLKSYIKSLNTEDKNINIALVNAGESFIFANFLKEINKQDDLWIVENSYTEEIFRMYSSAKVKICKLNNNKLGRIFRTLKNITYKYNDIQVNVYYPQYFWDEFWQNSPPKHYMERFFEFFNINTPLTELKEPSVSENAKNNIDNKIKKWNIDLDKTIILFPEAASINGIPNEFWIALIKKFNSEGYKVFVNSTKEYWKDKNVILNMENGAIKYLNSQEIYYFASLCKKITAIRNGYIELLLPLNLNMYVIYTNSHTFPNQNVRGLYSLLKYPRNPDILIREKLYKEIPDEILINKIVENYKGENK